MEDACPTNRVYTKLANKLVDTTFNTFLENPCKTGYPTSLWRPVYLPCKQFGQGFFLSPLQLPLAEGDRENIGGVKFRYIKIDAGLLGLGE